MKVKKRKTNIKRRIHGFRARMSSRAGRKIVRSRRRKGKKSLTG